MNEVFENVTIRHKNLSQSDMAVYFHADKFTCSRAVQRAGPNLASAIVPAGQDTVLTTKSTAPLGVDLAFLDCDDATGNGYMVEVVAEPAPVPNPRPALIAEWDIVSGAITGNIYWHGEQ